MDVIEIIPLQKPLVGAIQIGGSKSYTNRGKSSRSLTRSQV